MPHRFSARSLPRSCCRSILLGALATLPALFITPARAGWNALAGLQRGGAEVSAAAVDLNSGAVLQQLNADTRLTPASLTKLAVAAAALDAWPADKLFETRVLGAGPLRSGRLSGDLILQGAGDPSLDDDALWSLVAQVKGAGVAEVDGRLVVNPAPFDAVGCETQDRCDALQRSDTAYNAPLSPIGVDYGNWCVDVRPTSPGAAALVRGCGVAELPIPVEGTIKTRSGGQPTFWIERVTRDGSDLLRVGGEIATGSGQRMFRAMSDPGTGVGLLLREALKEFGVIVAGPVAVGDGRLPAGAYPVALVQGLSLREQLGRMLRFSNNYIADVLTLNLGAERGHSSRLSLSDASGALSEFVGRTLKAGTRTPPAPPRLYSGSGLTPENQLSANDLVSLLAYQYRDTRNFPAFYGNLVVPRQAPFAFLRQGSPAWLDRVALKTGTMNDPHSVCGIAGYLRKKDGGFIAFAVIVNGGQKTRHVPLYQSMEAARRDIDELLARY